MAGTKLDRWKKIAGSIPASSIEHSNKDQLINELATVPEEHVQEDKEEREDQEHIEGIESMNINNEYINDSDSENINNSFVQKVSQDVSKFIENKVTKEQTHKRTTILLRNDLRMKIANFDAYNGGRAKGLLLNFLLDDFFAELEESDPKWNRILNRKIPNFK